MATWEAESSMNAHLLGLIEFHVTLQELQWQNMFVHIVVHANKSWSVRSWSLPWVFGQVKAALSKTDGDESLGPSIYYRYLVVVDPPSCWHNSISLYAAYICFMVPIAHVSQAEFVFTNLQSTQ